MKARPKPRATGWPAVKRCADPRCRKQQEFALDAILQLKADIEFIQRENRRIVDESKETYDCNNQLVGQHYVLGEDIERSDKALASYVQSFHAHNAALRAILEAAGNDIAGTRYLPVKDWERAMELCK